MGAREDSHAKLPLPPTTYLRQVYLDTVVFSYHQLAYLVELFGPDRILMGSDYPFDMAEYNPVGHVAGIGLDDEDFSKSPAAMLHAFLILIFKTMRASCRVCAV